MNVGNYVRRNPRIGEWRDGVPSSVLLEGFAWRSFFGSITELSERGLGIVMAKYLWLWRVTIQGWMICQPKIRCLVEGFSVSIFLSRKESTVIGLFTGQRFL